MPPIHPRNHLAAVRAAQAALSLAMVTIPSTARAENAYFDPPQRNVLAGEIAQFDLYLSPMVVTGFDAADIVLGSNTITGLDFTFSDSFLSAMDSVTGPITGSDLYAEQIYVGGFLLSGEVTGPLHVGTLFAPTSGLANGVYTILIDGMADGVSSVSSGGLIEPLNTAQGGPIVATVRIPEPATSLMMVVSGLLIVRRHRA